MSKTISFESVKKKLLADPAVMREYEAQKTEFEVARALIKARISAKMTQTEVAKKMHTSQSQVARLESGEHFPSIQTIHKYAKAINHKIRLEITP
jgi:DNA-binding XRE family transcriptional regulator